MTLAQPFAALLLTVLLTVATSCSGGATSGSAGPEVPGDGNGDGDGDGGSPSDRLRDLVDDVVGLATELACGRFAGELRAWTDEHAAEIGKLAETLAQTEPAQVDELGAYVDEKVLLVTEAAAECGSDEAWEAWEHLERAVDEARE